MKAHTVIRGFIALVAVSLLFTMLTVQIPASAASPSTTPEERDGSLFATPQDGGAVLLGMTALVTPTATLQVPVGIEVEGRFSNQGLAQLSSIPTFMTLPFNDTGMQITQGWACHFGSSFCTTYYGPSGVHSGIDYVKDSFVSFDILAAASGTATCHTQGSYFGSGYGNMIQIDHDGLGAGYFTIYGHLPSCEFSSRYVAQGERIGSAGTTGASTGIHLHFELRNSSFSRVDPYDLWTTVYSYPQPGQTSPLAGPNHYWTTNPPSNTPANQPPYRPSLVAPANGSATNSSSVTLTWSDNGDPDNKPNAYRDYYTELYLNGTLLTQQTWSLPTSWTISNLSAGSYEWRVKSGDGVLPSGWAGPWRFTVDTTPPTGSFALNYGWATANSVRVPLDLTATDQHSGVQDVRLGSTCPTLGAWQPFQSRLWWQLAGQHGDTVRVCAQFRDRAGNVSQAIEQSTRLDFYPAQPASASYRLRSEVSASSGEPHQSNSYRLNSTAGQTLASGSYASSSGYRAALGFWPRSIQTSSTSTNQPPNRPTLLAPTNGSTASTSAPTFTWQDGGDPDNGPQATRSFRVSLHSLDGSLVAESGWLSGTSWTPPALSAGTYQWQVKAFDGAAESAWTGAWNLTIVTGTTTPDPYFKSDYTLGKPGSVFVFTAGNFPANAQATIAIRRPGMSDFATLVSLPVPASGTLVFVLVIEASAAPGVYTVRITVDGTQPLNASAETQAVLTLEQPITIAPEAELHNDPLPPGVPVVPATRLKVFLPLLMR